MIAAVWIMLAAVIVVSCAAPFVILFVARQASRRADKTLEPQRLGGRQ